MFNWFCLLLGSWSSTNVEAIVHKQNYLIDSNFVNEKVDLVRYDEVVCKMLALTQIFPIRMFLKYHLY